MPDRIGELASMEGYSPQEADFQFGVRATPWFGEFAQQHGEPNLNDPNYDYRAAWAAGARPNVRDPGDNQYHWPSQFKGPEHPNRFVNGVDTITGQPVSTGEEYAGLGGDPSHLAATIKNWWSNQPSWEDRARAENARTAEAFQRGGMGEVAKQLATDTTEAQELAGGFGGNIKGVKPPVAPGALAAIGEYRPPFYSAVEQAVQGAKQNAAPGQQWAGFLRNQPGVKPEEVEALKLGKLFEQPGSVPKEAVLGEIAANRVNVGEMIKSEQSQKAPATRVNEIDQQLHDIQSELDSLRGIGGMDERRAALMSHELSLSRERLQTVVNWQDQASGRTKFQQYTLPGGENYREMLLTLPDRVSADARTVQSFGVPAVKIRNTNDVADARRFNPNFRETFKNWDDQRILKAAKEAEMAPEQQPFKSSHYDEPNILAHVRYNDRVIDGKKTLFVEEVQSDWHQAGKRKGYRGEQEAELARLVRERDAIGKEIHDLGPDAVYTPEHGRRVDEMNVLHDRIRELGSSDVGVPDAPFKTTWPELAMKRIIREAAEKGYDKVAWTPGSVQAERYDLSKHVDSLHYNPDTKELRAYRKGEGSAIISKNDIEPKDLPNIVGKDVAEKLVNAPLDKTRNPAFGRVHSLEGTDLKVGGEGMKGFYDEILPATVNKLVKKHGGRVQQGEITEAVKKPTEYRDFQEYSEMRYKEKEGKLPKHSVHTLDITPALRAAAMKGFPLFTAGGVAATGVIGDLARQDNYQQ